VWCGECYGPLGNKPFPRQCPVDDDGVDQTQVGDELRYLQGRNGDQLLVPFQCDLCHFRNIMKRNPWESRWEDHEILEYIRRAILDSFWSRETSTVAFNLREARRMEKKVSDRLGMPSITPPMGPFPVEDVCGMKAAIALLDRSLDPGRYADHVQYGTFRKVRSTITNIVQAGVDGLGDSVGAYQRNKIWVTGAPTQKFWFSRFMEGLHKRVGEIRMPDRILSIEEVHAIDRTLEREWKHARSRVDQKRISEMGTWMSGGVCTGLRGEEMLLIDLYGTAKSVTQFMKSDSPDPHFKFVIIGRTKGVQEDGHKFAIPCVKEMLGTHLRPGVWVERLIAVKKEMGQTHGKLFARNLRRAKLVEFEDDFYRIIERIQDTTDLISPEVDVRSEYGLPRTTRRTATAHARNMRLPKDLMDAIHRWGKEMNAKTGVPRLDMQDTYTTIDSIAPLILEFSRGM
jgi:hypothetical protein